VNELNLTEAIEAGTRAMWSFTFSPHPYDDSGSPEDQWCENTARAVLSAAAAILERQVRDKIAQEIEASIIVDDEERYASCTCLAGVECHPHACHRVMNGVQADEDTWPVHVKIGVWRGLDPLIRNHAAAIARGSPPSSSTEEKGQR